MKTSMGNLLLVDTIKNHKIYGRWNA